MRIPSAVLSGVALLALSSPLQAADLPLKAARIAPVTVHSWTGFYVGGNVGYAWGDADTSTTGVADLAGLPPLQPGSATLDTNGGFAGVQAGYNWQVAPTWLVGLEADFQFSNIEGSVNCLVSCNTPLPPLGFQYYDFSVQNRLNWFGTVRGRVGYVAGPALLYVTGGLAYAEVERVATIGGTAFGFANFAGKYDNKTTKTGWTIGGGLESKLPGTWSALSLKAEYLYVDLGDVSDALRLDYTQPPFLGGPGATRTVTSEIHEHIFRVGLNYQFK